jgi:uncharacterized membrane protein YfcA
VITTEQIVLYLLIALIAFGAGFVHSAIGFGFGIVAVTLLPLVIEVKQSHVVISTASVPVLMMAAWAYRRGADPQALWKALAGAVIAMPIGLLAFQFMSPDWLIRGTGLAILVMVWMSFRNRSRAALNGETGKSSSAWLAGGIGGFLAGAVSIAGPPVAAFALAQQWDQTRFKAFINQFLLAVSVYKVLGLAVSGYLDLDALLQAALLAPAAVIGIQVGVIASRRLTMTKFQRVVAIVLIAIAIYFVVRGSG